MRTRKSSFILLPLLHGLVLPVELFNYTLMVKRRLCRLLTYILEHRTFYRAYLWEYPSRSHRDEMQRIFDGYLQPLFENYGVVNRNHMQYYYRFVAAGFLSVIAQWLEQETPERPEEIAGILYAMLRVPR